MPDLEKIGKPKDDSMQSAMQDRREGPQIAADDLIRKLRRLRDSYGNGSADLSPSQLDVYGASKLNTSLIHEFFQRRQDITHWQECQSEFTEMAWRIQSKEIL